jgi:diaminohydroxyphosphoribosylaminopyrimidine deaminase / 5-amino-6-(5-phosphoribosylamino)uracil reductase
MPKCSRCAPRAERRAARPPMSRSSPAVTPDARRHVRRCADRGRCRARRCATSDPNPESRGRRHRAIAGAGIGVSVGLLAARGARAQPRLFLALRARAALRAAQARDEPGCAHRPCGGGKAWISGEESRADVQHWRARSSAVLTGAGTVRVDDPRLDVRLDYGPWVRQPLRVLLDPRCPARRRPRYSAAAAPGVRAARAR